MIHKELRPIQLILGIITSAKPTRKIFALGILAALIAATPALETASAQSGYVDLVVTYFYGDHLFTGVGNGEVGFVVHNHGTAEARGVTVSLLLEKLEFGHYHRQRFAVQRLSLLVYRPRERGRKSEFHVGRRGNTARWQRHSFSILSG